MNSESSVPALIVGAGPVGMTMAAALTRHGVGVRIVDKGPTPTDKSKALVVWARTLELLDTVASAEPFLKAGRFLRGANINGNGKRVAHIPFEPAGAPYPKPLMLAQSETERLLTEHLRSVGVNIERSVELTALSDQGDHVRATLRRADRREESVRCDWLLGCDGAHSIVREQVGLEFAGEAEQNDWLLADVRIEGPLPNDELSIFWHHKGLVAYFPFGAGRCRVVADIGPAHGTGRPPDPSLAEVQAIVDERGPGGLRLVDPIWLAGFRIHERKVADYRRGRVFLAGDAAHIHSPAGCQGMNTGMQDAFNLAWKLALVHKGRGRADVLLDSYARERGAVGEMVLRNAGRLTRFAMLRNPVAQFLRNRIFSLVFRLPSVRRNFAMYLTELAVHYPHSPLNGSDDGTAWKRGVRPGDRLPDARLRDAKTNKERRLLAALDEPRHALLLLPDKAAAPILTAFADIARRVAKEFPELIRGHLIVPAATAPARDAFDAVWLDPEESVMKSLGACDAAMVLVRPDGYVAFRGHAGSRERLVQHLRGYLNAS
jgi:2-polyprenyl-6-methoxyphenol hydroxylase-like FAD-dependent oxidoreductase